MNINTLSEIIVLFDIEVIDSGLHRDIIDYINSMPSNSTLTH